MTRTRCCGNFRTPSCRPFHCCGTFPSRQMRVVSRWNSRRMFRSCWSLSFSRKAGWPHCFRVCHCLYRCGNLSLRGLGPEGTRNGLLRQPLWDVGIAPVGFRVQQRAGESRPSLADMPFISQQSSFLVTYVLRFDLLGFLQLHLHRLDVMEEYTVSWWPSMSINNWFFSNSTT